ncbi:MAG: RNA helicase, partial [Gammaproteobacteria bacterium]
RQIQRILKDDIRMETVAGFEPSQPVRMGSDAAGARRPGGNAARKPAHRPHGRPAARGAQPHAGPKQHSGGRGQGGRRDSRA